MVNLEMGEERERERMDRRDERERRLFWREREREVKLVGSVIGGTHW